MSIDKHLFDQLMEGRKPGDLFGKDGILQDLTMALAERALSTEQAQRQQPEDGDNGERQGRSGHPPRPQWQL